jgi:dTDP-4-dehydrorhamnose 3,5-epimerase
LKRVETEIEDVCLLAPDVFEDARGFLMESYNRERLAEFGILDVFVQDNHTRSVQYSLRGLHYQWQRPQAKLCRVVYGEVLDVVVDIRRGSPTFGKSMQVKLSADNKLQIYIPAGFAHGFLVLSDHADFLYKCSDFYVSELQRGIAWDDPALQIRWGIAQPMLSEKDRRQPRLADVPPEELPPYSGR